MFSTSLLDPALSSSEELSKKSFASFSAPASAPFVGIVGFSAGTAVLVVLSPAGTKGATAALIAGVEGATPPSLASLISLETSVASPHAELGFVFNKAVDFFLNNPAKSPGFLSDPSTTGFSVGDLFLSSTVNGAALLASACAAGGGIAGFLLSKVGILGVKFIETSD